MNSTCFNSEGHLNDEGVSLFVDALKLDQTDALPVRIKDHVENCDTCHHIITELYSTIGEVDYATQGVHPVFGKIREKATVRRLVYRIVAAAILAGFAFFFYDQYTSRELVEDQNLVQEDSLQLEAQQPFVEIPKDETKIRETEKYKVPENKASAPKQEKLIPKATEKDNRLLFAMNYTSNPDFEDFVGEVYRSSLFKLNGPDNGSEFTEREAISFSWNDTDNEAWVLLIFNNLGAEIYRFDISEPRFTFDNPLPPGLYYWKLETLEDLLHVGKFMVE